MLDEVLGTLQVMLFAAPIFGGTVYAYAEHGAWQEYLAAKITLQEEEYLRYERREGVYAATDRYVWPPPMPPSFFQPAAERGDTGRWDASGERAYAGAARLPRAIHVAGPPRRVLA